ncbi:hypothetical protein [Bacteroides acidifaciens]|uniref:hypothetical protein n=1 Tax=Bacteroides acidifaciens TaxID=85831 RepID=UPI0026F20955|nr:hypothetical protein [Bacteroides acidifaciens]
MAKQFNEIFNKACGNTGDSLATCITKVDIALKLSSRARLNTLTEIMYRKKVDEENLPDTFDDDLDEFGYTIAGMLEWTSAKVQTLVDDFVDIEAGSFCCEERLNNKSDMIENIKQDMSIYMKLKILVEMEQLRRNKLEDAQTVLSNKADKSDVSVDPYTGEYR